MELITLHPFDESLANAYVAALRGEQSPDSAWTWWSGAYPEAFARLAEERESDANVLTSGLALAMSDLYPSFMQDGFGFTTWEARIDRGLGMLMRPPARAFTDAGLPRAKTLHLPIRLDVQGGMMGGTYVPARLMDQLASMFDARLDRTARRIKDADMDPYRVLSLMRLAIDYARAEGLGLYEAVDILQPGMRIVEAPDRKGMDKALRQRIDAALAAEKKPGLIERLFGRGTSGAG